MFKPIIITFILYRLICAQVNVVTCPVGADKRITPDEIRLTAIGDFGYPRLQ